MWFRSAGQELKQIALEFCHNAAAVLEEANKWKPISAPPPEAATHDCLDFASGPTNMAMAFPANPPAVHDGIPSLAETFRPLGRPGCGVCTKGVWC